MRGSTPRSQPRSHCARRPRTHPAWWTGLREWGRVGVVGEWGSGGVEEWGSVRVCVWMCVREWESVRVGGGVRYRSVCTAYGIRHTSYGIRHTSHVTRHTAYVTHRVAGYDKRRRSVSPLLSLPRRCAPPSLTCCCMLCGCGVWLWCVVVVCGVWCVVCGVCCVSVCLCVCVSMCLYALCCMLYAVCCMLCAVCCMLYAVCCMVYGVCCMRCDSLHSQFTPRQPQY
jgi:hypothetical protein